MPSFIEVRDLGKKFNSTWIIKNLNLSFDEGEIAIIQGSSGIGKSTFLRCLCYLTPFEKGRVRVGSIEIEAGMNERKHHQTILALRQQLGFVFQSFNLFGHLTVLQNITIGPIKVWGVTPHKAEREAKALLRRVGLKNKAEEHPRSLSGGQQQRVAIARALALRPKGILFDEPTSNLDPAMKQEIVEVIEDFANDGLTMLIVTHEPAFLRRVATRLIEFGSQCSVVSENALPKLLLPASPPADNQNPDALAALTVSSPN
ncbi:MAG: amino acid ABC transporter ATP-binding protein [Elusimicrobia bacterium]|nr:amino acid ABC transporter ATP-binding protein [Elusimicrobiota bacterium]